MGLTLRLKQLSDSQSQDPPKNKGIFSLSINYYSLSKLLFPQIIIFYFIFSSIKLQN